jgi:hypothetical protein
MGPLPPVKVAKHFPPRQSGFHTPVSSANIAGLVASCQIQHTVPPSASIAGGRLAAQKQLAHFLGWLVAFGGVAGETVL